MDVYEATRVVLGRMQSLDAENAAKIMGYILIQEHGDKEMIRLAFGPEAALLSAVLKARKELGLAALPPFGLLAPQNSSGSSPLAVSFPTSFAPPLLFTRSGSGNSALNGSLDELQGSDELVCPSPSPFFNSGAAGGELLVDEFHLRNQLSCLKDLATGHNPEHSLPIGPRPAGGGGGTDLFHPEVGCRRPRSSEDGLPFPYRIGWGVDGDHHSWSWSPADVPLRSDATTAAGFGWKQCLYFARGYCKDGTACRFLHGQPNETAALAAASVRMDAAMEQQYQDLLLRSNGVGTSQLMASTFPKCQDFLFQQQQNDSQRAAATASLMRLRMEGMLNPGSRQIYLTFPADSTFTEEDVSNYFSIYGPVQDVRIPYQQKRMFGFVTFVYSETVKLILAKGNPHFVCDARVLVKPYKKKGKVPDKCRKQQQQNEREDFSSCTTPTGLESRDHYDLQQLGARMLYNNNISQEQLLLRRKLEEQRQVLELQLAIELQTRRFVNLQLKPKNYSLSSSAPAFINSPTIAATAAITVPTANTRSNGGINQEHSPTGEAEDQKVNSSNGFLNQKAVNSADKEESSDEANPNKDSDFHESTEHNLPNSPFASPTKLTVALNPSSVTETEVAASNAAIDDNNNTSDNHPNASTLLTPTSTLDMASYKSCFFQMPRFSSNHGAIGM